MRNIFDPESGGTDVVEDQLGESYAVVREVQSRIPELQDMVDLLNAGAATYANATNLSSSDTGKGANLIGASGGVWGTVQGFITYLLSSAGSSVLRFIHGDGGAVARTLESKLRDVVSAEDFGALGNGGDDAVALAAALATGKWVHISPNKTYGFGSQLVIPSGGGLVGGGTLKMLTGTGKFDFASYSGTTTGKAGILIDGKTNAKVQAKIEMEANAGIRTCNAIWVQGSTNAKLDVEITGFKECQFGLIEWNSNVGGHVEMYVHDCGTEVATGLPSLQISGLSVDNNRIGGVNSTPMLFYVRAQNLTQSLASVTAYGWQTDGVNLNGSGYGGHTGTVIAENVGEPFDAFTSHNNVKVVAKNCLFGVKLIHGAQHNVVEATVDRYEKAAALISGTSTGSRETSNNRITLTATGGGDVGTFNDVCAVLIEGASFTYSANRNTVDVTSFSDGVNLDFIAAINGGDNNSITYEGTGWSQQADRIVSGSGVNNQIRRKRKAHVRANLATNTAIANDTIVVFSSETADTYGEYNPATGVYTAKATTTLRVKFGCRVVAVPAGAEYGSYIRKGSSVVSRKTNKNTGATNSDLFHEHSATVNVVPGDLIFIRTDSSGNTHTYGGGIETTYLEIEEA